MRTLTYQIGSLVAALALAADAAWALPDPVDDLLRHHAAVVSLEVQLAESQLEFLVDRELCVRQLHQSGHSSWTEVMAAQVGRQEAELRIQALGRCLTHLNQLAATRAAAAGPSDSADRPLRLTVEFRLPDSHAVLGWIDVSRLPNDRQTSVLDLIETESRLSNTRSQAMAMARHRVTVQEDILAGLLKADTDILTERRQVRQQLQLARMAEPLLLAQQNLAESEGRLLRAAIACIRETARTQSPESPGPPDDSGKPDDLPPSPMHALPTSAAGDAWLIAILQTEARNNGRRRMAEVLFDWSSQTNSAAARLLRSGFMSPLDVSISRSEQEVLRQTLDASLAHQRFREHWLAELQAATSAVEPPELNSHELPTPDWSCGIADDPRRLIRFLRLLQERVVLEVRHDVLPYQMDMQRTLLTRLQAQTQPNPGEVRQGQLLLELLEQQRQDSAEQIRINELLLLSQLALSECQKACPVHLRHVDHRAAAVIREAVDGEYQRARAAMHDDVSRKHSEHRLQQLRLLRKQGFASRREVLDAEQQCLDALAQAEELQAQERRVDLQRQLVVTLLSIMNR